MNPGGEGSTSPPACRFAFCAHLVLGAGQTGRAVIRQHVKDLDLDRPLHPDHGAMKDLLESGELLDAMERAIGTLALDAELIEVGASAR